VYNLIMTGAQGAWDGTRYDLERDRVGEYTDDALRARYRVLDERTIAELLSLPTLFAYEKVQDAPARVGRVTRVATRGNRVRFEYQILAGVPPIPPARLLELARNLDIDVDGWEMNRTHWAVKDVDLIEVLSAAGFETREIRASLSDALAPVSQPTLSVSSLVVERALGDAEKLVESQGATSGVDRVHTALHGYMIALCEGVGWTLPSDPSITDLWKALREKHPALQHTGAGASDIHRVLRAFATIVDALNPLRNKASVAHPNPNLLEEPEAMLVINSVRTLLHYLDSRVKRT
jgi:hypothetical protein